MADVKVNFLKKQKEQSGRLLSLAIALGSMSGLLVIAQAWFLALIINKVIFEKGSLSDVMPWLWMMLGILILRAVIVYFSEQVAFSASADIKQNLRNRLFNHIQLLGPGYLSNESSGDISTVISDGVEKLESYYARYLPAMSLAVWVPLSILVFVFPLDWKSALVMILTAPLIPLFMILIGRGAEKLNQSQWKQLVRMGGHFLDVIQGLTTLKLYNASRREAEVISRISEDYRHATMKVLRLAFLSSLALEFFATISIAIVAVLIGFRLLFAEMEFINGFFILLLAPEFYLPLRSLGTHYHARMDAIATVENIIDILDTPLPVKSETSSKLLPEHAISIQFQDIHFSYDGRSALNGVSVNINPQERVALVGSSGSGKSTLVNMLLGFIQPDKGKLLINNTDFGDLDLKHWRSLIGWVPQRPKLFHATIAENVNLGLNNLDRDKILYALEQAQALDFIQQLPLGIDTVVGEGARQLSGGQIQRLALARAFLRDAKFLILDEPTAHMDKYNEQLIQRSIENLSQGRTVLTVAHRLSTVKTADRILVLEQGKILQQGSHQELIRQTGFYQQLLSASGEIK